MLKILTRQKNSIYSKDANVNPKIYEQTQLKGFSYFSTLKKRCFPWEVEKRINRIERKRQRGERVGGSSFTRNIYTPNSKELDIPIYTHHVHIYKDSRKLEVGFGFYLKVSEKNY